MSKSGPSPLPVVLVGCGAVSQNFYAPALEESNRENETNVVALADPDPNAREALGCRFRSAIAKSRIEEIHASSAPSGSLCIVASPPKYHLSIARVAFERGWHVLCEKPMAATADECIAMIDAGIHANRLLAVGLYKRFMPAHRTIKSFIEKQTFGRLQSVLIAEGGKFKWPASDSFFKKESTPGGVLLDIGVHVLDLLLWWLGDPEEFDYADDSRDGLEANCVVTAIFQHPGIHREAPIHVRVRLSRDWKTENCYCFRFDRVTIHCRVNASNHLEFTFDDLPMTFAAELRDPIAAIPSPQTLPLETNPQAFVAQLIDVCSAIRNKHLPMITGKEGSRSIRWIEKCYASSRKLSESWQNPVLV